MPLRPLGVGVLRRGWRTAVRGTALAAVVIAFATMPSDVDQTKSDVGLASEPGLRPPAVTVDRAVDGAVPGAILLAPFKGDAQPGPMILNSRGEMVWFHPVPEGKTAMNFQAQKLQGEPVLTWWEGEIQEDGYGRGQYVVADDSYREIARFDTAGGRPGDFHEFQITPRGTALVTIYRPVPHDLTALGGEADDTVLDSCIQEIDIDTGKVLFRWDALDHVNLRESHEPLPEDPEEPYDFFHVNSVDVDADGNLLVSARHTDTVYKLNRRTGKVIWRLGGTRSDFRLGPGAEFFSQHDARRRADGTITLYDNGNPPRRHVYSRAITLRLDERKRTARLVRGLQLPQGVSSKSQGNAQELPGDRMFVGSGSEPYLTLFGADEEVEFEAELPDGTQNYRAFTAPWAGHPATRPEFAVTRAADNHLTLQMSWNGSTEVRSWQVLAGPAPGDLKPVASADRSGFETMVRVHSAQPYLAVRALDGLGRPLRRSAVEPLG